MFRAEVMKFVVCFGSAEFAGFFRFFCCLLFLVKKINKSKSCFFPFCFSFFFILSFLFFSGSAFISVECGDDGCRFPRFSYADPLSSVQCSGDEIRHYFVSSVRRFHFF